MIASVLLLLVPLSAVVPPYEVESLRFRYTNYDQAGRGYQSAAGPAGQAGSEQATILQPQAEVVARIGNRVTQRIWVPLDVVTAASPDHSRYPRAAGAPPLDAVSTASRTNVAGSFDALTSYRWDAVTAVQFRTNFHIEEPFESWGFGLGGTRSFAEDNTVLAASFNQIADWFDRFDIAGERHGRANRSTSNLNVSLTQLLSPTTVVAVSYGATLQVGTMGNTWTSALLSDGTRADERLPRHRQRHALAGKMAQWVPWGAVWKWGYRAYLDDWGAGAHSVETDLTQRLGRRLRIRGNYRWHWQSGVRFFSTGAAATDALRTADSDLARFSAQTIGGAIAVDVTPGVGKGWAAGVQDVHFDVGYERYVRSNNLDVDITTCGIGFRF